MNSPTVVQTHGINLHAIDNAGMQALLDRWVEHDWLRGLDAAFARFLWTEVPQAHPLLILAAALASHQLGRGHACLDLAATLHDPAFALSLPPEGLPGYGSDAQEHPLPLPADVLAGVDMTSWQIALQNPVLVSDGPGNTPLVHKGSRLYLRRYWCYEQDVREAIDHRLSLSMEQQRPWSVAQLRKLLDVLFAAAVGVSPDWQKLACALAARSAFSVITGGPGTGKTTTVVTLLALLQALALGDTATSDGRALRIRLAAPTGKAAARLSASIADAIKRLPLITLAQAIDTPEERIRENIPDSVTTLHRLLGSKPDSRHFRHHAGNPLALDVLVIDEASMVDLEMMAAVLAALPPGARVILLGDKDQLASVEAGAVLGQLCHRASGGHYTASSADWLTQASGQQVPSVFVDTQGQKLDQAVVMLRHSHRFAADSGIDTLAQAVNGGDVAAVADIWKQSYPDLKLVSHAARDPIVFRDLILSGASVSSTDAGVTPAYGYGHYLDMLTQHRPTLDAGNVAFDDWAKQVLDAHAKFQVLCAVRSGAWGVEGLNLRIAAVLQKAGHIPAIDGWYVGRPVLVVRNDYSLGLMNGDIGITLELPGPDGISWLPRVAFPDPQTERGIKWVLPSRLQAVETVYALTVHKSQGSEFSHTVLILSESVSPILTRELLYTGITRARTRFTLVNPGPASVLNQAILRRVLRVGGLI